MRERQFEALLSQKILEPNSETIKKIDLPYFSACFDEILELRRKFGLDMREALIKLRIHFRLYQRFSREVFQRTSSQVFQLIFLCLFIAAYSYFLTQFFPKLNHLRWKVLIFNLFGTILLIGLTSLLNIILFHRVWSVMFLLFKVCLQLDLGLSTNQVTSHTLRSFWFDIKLKTIIQRQEQLFDLFNKRGESILKETNFLLEELISLLELRIRSFGNLLNLLKLSLLAIFFLPSLFYLNLHMMRSALGQVL